MSQDYYKHATSSTSVFVKPDSKLLMNSLYFPEGSTEPFFSVEIEVDGFTVRFTIRDISSFRAMLEQGLEKIVLTQKMSIDKHRRT